MADDKQGRDKQAQDADRRQRERGIVEELERKDETEPPVETAAFDELEEELDPIAFPVTGVDVVAAIGDRKVESTDGTYRISEFVPETDEEQFDAPSAVRLRIRRPTIAAAMKQIVEAGAAHNTNFCRSNGYQVRNDEWLGV